MRSTLLGCVGSRTGINRSLLFSLVNSITALVDPFQLPIEEETSVGKSLAGREVGKS